MPPANDNDKPITFSIAAILTEHREISEQRIDASKHPRAWLDRERYLEELERLADNRAEECLRLVIAPFVPTEDLATAASARRGRVEELALYGAWRALHPRKT